MPENQSEPATVTARSGKVMERKPDGSEISMSPSDAVVTAQRLLEAASEAEGDARIAKPCGT